MERTSLLIPFDLIVDIDYAIIQEVKEKYSETQYINKKILEGITEDNIFSILSTRKSINVLELLLEADYKSAADNLYKEIIEDDYKSLIEKSSITNITQLVEEYINTSLVDVTIWCKNSIEEQYIRKNINKINVTISESIKDIDISLYTAIFLKDIRDAKDLKTAGMTIYMGNYRFNYGDYDDSGAHKSTGKRTVEPLTEYVTNGTEIKSIDIYTINEKDRIEG